jgi:hypothetical protein
VLGEAIAAGGSTLRDFRNAHGEVGQYQGQARVYGRQGEPCARCGRPIRRIVQTSVRLISAQAASAAERRAGTRHAFARMPRPPVARHRRAAVFLMRRHDPSSPTMPLNHTAERQLAMQPFLVPGLDALADWRLALEAELASLERVLSGSDLLDPAAADASKALRQRREPSW